ncbi:hypothetical protein SK128_018969 [Halocaridina rubra]|uniref:DNA/RNA non-specific endonuclease/pyrophosphatase/phosphodiesterase domain-containing protein n=1 Tax=Halocaridina rubra TaxID=373956 RepID=A0AAN9A5E1_HALRR
MSVLWVVFGLLICLISKGSFTGGCSIYYDFGISAKHHHPMALRRDGEGFLYPVLRDGIRILHFPSNGGVWLSCPGDKNSLFLNSRTRTYITCSGNHLYYGKQRVMWPQLGCKDKPKPSLDRFEESCGASKEGRMYAVHWPIRRGVDIRQIDICFDEMRETALFTYHQINGNHTDAKIIESSRPSFKRTNMITINANRVYTIKAQKALFTQLLHSGRHLTGEREHYLARGHLTPDSDFVLAPEQDATYYYANVVPQWQAVNNGNWKSLEYSVREVAERRRSILNVWTGTHGVLKLPDSRNRFVDLFLGSGVRRTVIPVPAFMWKVIHDPVRNDAIAIVLVNDVGGYGQSDGLSLQEEPCLDMCHLILWVDWDVTDYNSGRTFCCHIENLKNTIHNVPDLGDVRILASI